MSKLRKQIAIALTIISLVLLVGVYFIYAPVTGQVLGDTALYVPDTLWQYQCLDTMKYSRDQAREFLGNPERADAFITNETATIKNLGANCVALGTPYDEEFIPVLTKWVAAARKEGLAVWYRGNMSGWEGWFGYAKFKSPEEHNAGMYAFITKHPQLFEDWDIITPAPEAENGLLGSPWRSDEAKQQLRQFVISSYDNCQKALTAIGKKTSCGYFSANGDVAEQVYNKDSVAKTGGTIVIDHYIKDPARMGRDIARLSQKQNATILVGEFGAPIPDINGKMTETEQANFIRDLLKQMYVNKKVIQGINYWVIRGGSTALINDNGTLRQATEVIKDYFLPGVVRGQVVDGLGQPLSGISVKTGDGVQQQVTDKAGGFGFALPVGKTDLVFDNPDFVGTTASVSLTRGERETLSIRVEPKNPRVWYKLRLKAKLRH